MNEELRYDGLYREMRSDGHCRWYRFYESGEVLSASTSPGPVRQVAGWLRRDGRAEHTPIGEFRREGDRLRFTLRWSLPAPHDAPKSSDHEVVLEGGQLLESFVSARTGKTVKTVYDFVPLCEEDLEGDPKKRKYRRIASWKKLAETGLDAARIAELKKSKAVTIGVLNSGTREDFVGAGLSQNEADTLLEWRDGG